MIKFSHIIFVMFRNCIEQGETLEQISQHEVLKKHFSPPEIEIYYNLTLERMEYQKFRRENFKNHKISIRLSQKDFELIKKASKDNKIRPPELFRRAIYEVYGKDKPILI